MFKRRRDRQGKGGPHTSANSSAPPIRQGHRPDNKQAKNKGMKREIQKKDPALDTFTDSPQKRNKHPTEEVEALYEETSQVFDSYHKGVGSIAQKVARLTPEELREYKTKVYDDFSINIDQHMENTNHNPPSRNIIDTQAFVLRLPLIDPSVGTGILFEHVLMKFFEAFFVYKRIQEIHSKKRRDVDSTLELVTLLRRASKLPRINLPEKSEFPLFVLNDLSSGMHERLRERLARVARYFPESKYMSEHEVDVLQSMIDRFVSRQVRFEQRPIEDLPEDYLSHFACAFVSNTMHIATSREPLIYALYKIMRPGGNVLSLEEFPFYITDSPHIKMVRETLRLTTQKMEGKDAYMYLMRHINQIVSKDTEIDPGFVFDKVGDEKQERIDDLHKMYGFRFRKRGTLFYPQKPDIWDPWE